MAGFDPFGSMQGFINQFSGFMRNPVQAMMQSRLNIPQNLVNNPNNAIQYLMNNGQMSQGQYNQLQQMASKIQQNPQFMEMFGRRR